jgi:hypothetical protein
MATGSGKAKQIFIVGCQRHGVEIWKNAGKEVKVGQPKSKKARFNSGCPMCKQEQARASK